MTKTSTLTWRWVVASAAVAAALGLSGCDVPGAFAGGDWRTEPRCQPPGGGFEPWQVLPDREKCPEAYEGNGSSGSVPGLPGLPGYSPGAPYVPRPTPPCSTVPSLNGFPCFDVDPHGNPGPYYP